MKLPGWLQDVVKYVAVEIVTRFIKEFLVDDSIKVKIASACQTAGKWVSNNCRDGIGESWETVETAIQEIKNIANTNFDIGLDADDVS